MPDNLAVFKYCFPEVPFEETSALGYTKAVLDMMHKDGSVNYNGFMDDETFVNDIQDRVKGISNEVYRHPSEDQKKELESAISDALLESEKHLNHPDKPLFIFVFPWFPSEEDTKSFGGVTAVARHSRVMHLFINFDSYSKESLMDTVTHEYNHLVYYLMYGLGPFSVEENILMEGLAEVFKDEVTHTKASPWAKALSEEEAMESFESLKPNLSLKDSDLIKQVLFGGGNFKRWTGYSVGYWLIKRFREKNLNLSWEEIMQKKETYY